MIDWNGDPDELLTLNEAAALIPRADANTLKRLIRSGKLRAYRPGKKYLTTRADVRAAVIACRVPPPAGRESREIKPPQETPDPFGRTTSQIASDRLKYVLEQAFRVHREAARLRKEERARTAPARKEASRLRRNKRAREAYRQKKEALLKEQP